MSDVGGGWGGVVKTEAPPPPPLRAGVGGRGAPPPPPAPSPAPGGGFAPPPGMGVASAPPPPRGDSRAAASAASAVVGSREASAAAAGTSADARADARRAVGFAKHAGVHRSRGGDHGVGDGADRSESHPAHVRDANYDRLAAKLVNLAVEREQTMWKRAHEPIVTGVLRERLERFCAQEVREMKRRADEGRT